MQAADKEEFLKAIGQATDGDELFTFVCLFGGDFLFFRLNNLHDLHDVSIVVPPSALLNLQNVKLHFEHALPGVETIVQSKAGLCRLIH